MKQYIWVAFAVIAAVIICVLITLKVYKAHINKTIKSGKKNSWISYPFIIALILILGGGSIFSFYYSQAAYQKKLKSSFTMTSETVEPLKLGDYFRSVRKKVINFCHVDDDPEIMFATGFGDMTFNDGGLISLDLSGLSYIADIHGAYYTYSTEYDVETKTTSFVFTGGLNVEGLINKEYMVDSILALPYAFDNICLSKMKEKAGGSEYGLKTRFLKQSTLSSAVAGFFIEDGDIVEYTSAAPKQISGNYLAVDFSSSTQLTATTYYLEIPSLYLG